jgi:phosphoribosylglycinamide formyltransferase 1
LSKPRGRLAVLVSGSGSNLEAILQAKERGELTVDVALVISSKPGVFALERAQRRGIPTIVIEARKGGEKEFEAAMLQALDEKKPDLICLAGYLRKLGPGLIARYRGRILNIHPALLPKYGGPGMWGRHVHEAVLAAKETESGCSVHLVDEEFDHGEILAQARVPIFPDDTATSLAARVLEQEHKIYPLSIQQFWNKSLSQLEDRSA